MKLDVRRLRPRRVLPIRRVDAVYDPGDGRARQINLSLRGVLAPGQVTVWWAWR